MNVVSSKLHGKMYGSRTIKVSARGYSKSNIDSMIESAIQEVKAICPNVDTQYCSRLDGRNYYAYVDTQVHTVLIGLNPDGTDRVCNVDVDAMNWKDRMNTVFCAPGVSQLPPLVAFPLPVCTARVDPVSPKRMHNVLRTKNCPSSITEAEVKSHFKMFCTDSTTIVDRVVGGKIISETYPFVTINPKNEIFVAFDPNTYDACFAMLVSCNLEIRGFTLVFTHSFKTSRDIAAAASRSPQVKSKKPCKNLYKSEKITINTQVSTNSFALLSN